MLKLYSAPRTRSFRIAWLLEEIQQPYELIKGTFQTTGSQFFIQQTPTGKYPTIDDDGFVMFESGAIIEYLLGKYDEGTLMPRRGTSQHGEYLQWMYFADATAFAPIGVVVWLSRYRDDASEHPQLINDAVERAKTSLRFLDEHMGGRTWLVDETFTAADVMMGFTLLSAEAVGVLAAGSNLASYLDRLRARPAFVAAYAKTNGS